MRRTKTLRERAEQWARKAADSDDPVHFWSALVGYEVGYRTAMRERRRKP